jgi:cytidylate kinase
MNRSNSPLKKAPDAVLINTENMNLEEVENEILNHISIALPNSL